MSILITGNKGFIGSKIDHEADGIDLKDGLDIVTYEATQKYDVVIHTAAKVSVPESMENPKEYFRTNVLGTLNMLKQHPEAHFIYLSTSAIYGEGENHTTDSQLKPESIYAITKLTGEFLIKSMAKSHVILRLTNVIGEGERGEPNVYQIFDKSETLTIFGDGRQTRDFVPLSKVCQAIEWAFDKKGVFNVGSGRSKTIYEVAREFNKPIKFLPARAGEIRNFGVADALDFNSESL